MRATVQERVRQCVSAAMVLGLAIAAARADGRETIQRAVDAALQAVSGELGRQTFPNVKNIAVVPLRGDQDEYVTERVRDAITKTPFALFTRSDATWKTLLQELEWGVRREDVMDPNTVQRFGKIEGVDAILYGVVWDQSVNLWSIRAHAKLSLILADVETGRDLWRSGPLEGEAFVHWSEALMSFWQYPAFLLGFLVMLSVLALVVARMKRLFRPL